LSIEANGDFNFKNGNASFGGNATLVGSLGIGTSTPSDKLHVKTGPDDGYAIRIEGSTYNEAGAWTGLGIGGENANTKSALIFQDIGNNYSRGKLHLCVNNELNQNSAIPADAKLTISNDGNVGIGTTSPTHKLDVNGTFRAVGNATIGGNIKVKFNESYFTNYTTNGIDYFGDNQSFTIKDEGVNKLKIEGSGKVKAFGEFEAVGNASFGGNIEISNTFAALFRQTNTLNGVAQSWIRYVGSNGDNIFRDDTNSRTHLVFQNNGITKIATDATFEGKVEIKQSGSTPARIYLYAEGSGDASIIFDAMDGDGIGSNYGTIGQLNTGELEYNIRANSPNPIHKFVGNATFSSKVDVVGLVTADDFKTGSDIRLKKDITELEPKRLQPKRFIWKKSGKKDIGFVADELMVHFPEIVDIGEDTIKRVSYHKITAINSASINELYDENISLRNEIELIKKHLGI
jgi:hypothetical protein